MSIWEELKLVHLASRASFYRGILYYQNKSVVNEVCSGSGVYEGEVNGSQDNVYNVLIDINHPRKSTCTCPFSKGRRVICKHMVALYFSQFPKQADAIIAEWEEEERAHEESYNEWADEYQKERLKEIEEITAFVNSLSVEQVRKKLIDALLKEFDSEYPDYDYFDDYYSDDYYYK
ncbi:hypothetical protein AT575_04865 [Streptococcus penaeicida]|uniref:SWIM-type domain-containing protein n=1 Tax=Streptococcus penaeicida TaxID=1765960 RepID=A0A2N8LC35_9STRE|nr:SWIM zinc finger family protein [Streptococcus penaeicida]PND47731.1 hypothetical protein AT575_04865 [Streptococcus penaeicida]